MIQIHLYTPHGHEYPVNVHTKVSTLPRVGEMIEHKDIVYEVSTIIHLLYLDVVHVRVK